MPNGRYRPLVQTVEYMSTKSSERRKIINTTCTQQHNEKQTALVLIDLRQMLKMAAVKLLVNFTPRSEK